MRACAPLLDELALRADPPLVPVFSTTTTRSPDVNGALTRLPVPCVFASFRTVNARGTIVVMRASTYKRTLAV